MIVFVQLASPASSMRWGFVIANIGNELHYSGCGSLSLEVVLDGLLIFSTTTPWFMYRHCIFMSQLTEMTIKPMGGHWCHVMPILIDSFSTYCGPRKNTVRKILNQVHVWIIRLSQRWIFLCAQTSPNVMLGELFNIRKRRIHYSQIF